MNFNIFAKRDQRIADTIDKMYKEVLVEELAEMEKRYSLLLAKTPQSTIEYANRLADLEIKMAKLWSMLTDQSMTGKDKLSKYGKTFGGKSKSLM